jgi:hypothetical protein
MHPDRFQVEEFWFACHLARQAFAELKAAKGSRRRAGWLEWDAVKDERE